MTPEQLIHEGRKLERRCVFLRPRGTGPVAGVWHSLDQAEIESTGHRCWITVDSRFIPGLSPQVVGFISVFTDEVKCQGGRVVLSSARPGTPGIELYAREESVLPPIEAVFARGSDAVAEWLQANDWSRDDRYNDNFPDRAVTTAYEQIWFKEYPLYRQDDTYAVLGGWHWPCADEDFHDLIN
jgi:hypothetical protein